MYINSATNSRFAIDVSPAETVGRLKELIVDEIGIPASYQVLSYKGAMLKDEETLESAGLNNFSSEVYIYTHTCIPLFIRS